MKRSLSLVVCTFTALCCGPKAQAVDRDALLMWAQLVSPINSRTNQKGDRVTALVSSPPLYRGDQLEGVIEEARSSGDIKKTSSLRFVFKTLTHQGKSIPITADITRFQNSKGQPGVDEEGRSVKKSSGVGKAVAAAAIGAGIGALFGGAKGAAIGAGAGLAVGFVFVSVAVKGPEISFDSKSMFELAVKACERCPATEAALESRQFTNEWFTFSYPRQWKAYSDPRGSRVSVAPPFGVRAQPNGAIDIGYGAMIGLYSPEAFAGGDLARSTAGLIRILQSDSPDLQVASDGQEVMAGGTRFYVIALNGQSQLEEGRDVSLLITMMHPEGLFYYIGIAPASRSQEIRVFSLNILQSLSFRK